MSHLGNVHDHEQEADNEIPTRPTGVPEIVLQQPTPLSGGARSLPSNQRGPGSSFSGNPNIQPGKIQIRELFHLALAHDKSNDASCRPPTDGDCCKDENHHRNEDRNEEHKENIEIEPWVKLTTQGVRSTVAEFIPLNRGFSLPSLNPFGVEFHSGVLDRGPNQSIYFSRGHPTSQPTNRECVSRIILSWGDIFR